MRFLAETGTLLASTLDLEVTLAQLGGALVPAVADYCIIDLVEEGRPLRQAALRHVEPAKEELLRELRRLYPPDGNPDHPASRVLASGTPLLIEQVDERVLGAASLDERHPPALPRPRADVLRRRAVACPRRHARHALARNRPVGRVQARRCPLRRRGGEPDRARGGERAALRGRPVLLRSPRHAAALGARGDRLLGSRSPLRARQRCARRDQRLPVGEHVGRVARGREAGASPPASSRSTKRS